MHSRFGMSNRNRIIGSLSLRRLYNGMGNPNSAAMMTIPMMMMMMKKNTSGALREQRQQKLNNSHPTIRHFYKNVMQLDSNGNAETVDGKQKPQCLLIDGTPLVVRAFHGTKVNMVNEHGVPVNALYTYIKMLLNFILESEYDYIGVFFDHGRKTFRTNISKDYKANRAATDPNLKVQFPLTQEATKVLGCPMIMQEGYEADDLIASYARHAQQLGCRVTIVSSDKDMCQLINDDVNIFDPIAKKEIGIEEVVHKFGVHPSMMPQMQALMGDKADNIPGVPGVGPKTASKLLEQFGSLENILQNIESIKSKKIRESMNAHASDVLQSLELVTLKSDLEAPHFEEFRRQDFDYDSVIGFLRENRFESIVKLLEKHRTAALRNESARSNGKEQDTALFGDSITEEEEKEMRIRIFNAEYEVVDTVEALDQWIANAREKGRVCLTTLLSIPKAHDNNLCGISLSIEASKACYIPLLHKYGDIGFHESIDALKGDPLLRRLKTDLFEDESIVKIMHNGKEHIKNLHPYGIEIKNFDDVMVMSYVLNCGKHDNSMESLIEHVLEENAKEMLIDPKDVVGMGQKKVTFAMAPTIPTTQYVCQFADYTARLYDNLNPQLQRNPRLGNFYRTIELPLVTALADLEIHGVVVDRNALKAMAIEYDQKIDETRDKIMAIADEPELNINSNQQLGLVLFDKLMLDPKRKIAKKSAKTGFYVVDVTTLDALAAEGHEIAKLLVQYRALTKLHGTYIAGLQHHINPYTNRIHTTYQNALTVTGRLSCTAPNLQNIPIRTNEGREIRKKFTVPPGCRMIKADYSQVELRILAHVAHIDVLRDAFREGKDVHSITASQVFGVPVEQVDKEMRRKAKAINFGIIYGMSEYGLAKQINVDVRQAREYIALYFKQYPGIKRYMENTKQFCRNHGFVNTLFGRKCWIPDINDSNKNKRGFAERTAINTPIQGTSADVTKIAMNTIHSELKKRGLKSNMIIQVHDEIVLEVPEEELDIVVPLVKQSMEAVGDFGKFSVPLTVDVEIAQDWIGSE